MNEFIEKYGTEILEELFDILNNKDDKYRYNDCDDDLCDAEDCRLNKAFKMFMKYRQFIVYTVLPTFKITDKMSKITKIDAAIKDTKLYLKKAEEDIMLLMREKKVLQDRISALETIKDSDQYE